MKLVINDHRTHELEFVYTENVWTGRRTITFNGKQAEKKSRNLYVLHLPNGDIEFQIKGNNFTGVTVQSPVFREPVEVRKKLPPLAYVFSVLAFVLGVVGGFLGGWAGGVFGGFLQGSAYGAISGFFFGLVLFAVMSIERKWLRYLVCAEMVLVCAGLTFFTGYGFALLQLALL